MLNIKKVTYFSLTMRFVYDILHVHSKVVKKVLIFEKWEDVLKNPDWVNEWFEV